MTQIKTMYWLPHCSTCQKAETHLKELGIAIADYHDLKATAIDADALSVLIEGIGGAENLFSKRAMKFRSMGLDKLELSPEQLTQYMLDEYTFIKRPVLLLDDGRVMAGYSAKQYSSIFKN